MSISDTAQAKRYASIAEVAAAQCQQYTEEARNAPEYTNLAKQYAESANDAADAALLSATQAQASANGASQSASAAQTSSDQASTSSQTAVQAADASQQSASAAAADAAQAAADAATVAAAANKTLRVSDSDIPALPNAATRAGKALTCDSSGNFQFTVPASGSAEDVLNELALSTGSTLIGDGSQTVAQSLSQKVLSSALSAATNAAAGSDLVGVPTGQTLTSYLSTARGIDPRMPPYNYRDSDDLPTRTASLQAAFDAANTPLSSGKKAVFLAGLYRVDKLILHDHSDYAIIGYGGIVLEGTGGSGVFGIDMKNCRNINFEGAFSINGATGYAGAVKVWTDVSSGTSLLNLRMTMVDFDIGYYFGDFSYPDGLVSEINVSDSYTYNVRSCLWAVGSQTVINISRCNLIATNGTIGSTQVGVVTMYGGSIKWNAGEVLMPDYPSGQMVRSFPIDSPLYAKAYGIITITGCAIESAGLWFIAYNINSIASPAAGTGGFILSACTGYAPFSGQNIQVDGNFSGKIDIDHTCFFHREQAGAKSTVTVICSSNSLPLIRLHNDAFDSYFLKGFNAITGGIPVYSFRQLTQVTNLGGVTYGANSTNDLVFQAKNAGGDNPYYGSYYSTANGKFVVPAGGLKSVKIHVELSLSAAISAGTLSVLVAGVVTGQCGIPSSRICANFDIGDVNGGAEIILRLYNPGAAVNTTSSNLDMMIISSAN